MKLKHKQKQKLNSAITRLDFRVPYGHDMILIAYFDTSDRPALAIFTSNHFGDSHCIIKEFKGCYSDRGTSATKYRRAARIEIPDMVEKLNAWNPDYLDSPKQISIY